MVDSTTCKPKPEPQKLSRKIVEPSRAGFLLSQSREISKPSQEKIMQLFSYKNRLIYGASYMTTMLNFFQQNRLAVLVVHVHSSK